MVVSGRWDIALTELDLRRLDPERPWATDADGDGRADPQDIDDTALAAGRYLCNQSRDLTTGEGWWAAVLSYNNSVSHAQQVLDAANTYAQLSLRPG